MNDSFRSNVFVRYYPETIACACIYLAARQLQIALPNNPQWFSLFDVDEDQIKDVCYSILRLYRRRKPNQDRLEEAVNELKQAILEAKIKAKGLSERSANATPNSTSRAGSPSKISPPPHPALHHLKDEDGHSDSSGRDYNHKKRSHTRSRSRSRSKSRTFSSRGSSRSTSRSPGRRHRSSPYKKYKKERDREKDYHRHSSNSKSKHHSSSGRKRHRSPSLPRSRSHSPTPPPVEQRKSRKYHGHHKYRSRSRSPVYLKDKYTSRSRSRSRSRDARKSKKHNGHHRSRSRDRYRR